MIATGLMLGLGFTILEVYIVTNFTWLHRKYIDGAKVLFFGPRIPGELISVIFSLSLSALVGALFPAVGGAILAAAVFSTGFSLAYFAYERGVLEHHNCSPRELWAARWARWQANWDENMELFRDLWKVAVFFAKAITSPLRGYRRAKNFINTHTHPTNP